MAGAIAAVERRKASALRSARAASDDAANSFAPFGALPPLIFWRRTLRAVRCQNSDADASRERFFTSSLPDLIRQSMGQPRSLYLSHVSMDHRVKPGGDETKDATDLFRIGDLERN
jgi:hypothetical protein